MAELSFIEELMKSKNDINLAFTPQFDRFDILKNICGLLNSTGGWIIVGHTGKNFTSIVVSDDDLNFLKQEINTSISPRSLVYLTKEKEESYEVILINVLQGSRQPYTFDGKYYIYSERSALVASPDDISLLLRTSNEYSSTWEKATVIDSRLSDLDQEEIHNTITTANKLTKDRLLPNDPGEFLNYFQLADFGNIKNGAIVLFGKDPIKFLPQCRIRITVLPEGKTGDMYDDIILIESHLFDAYIKVQEYFAKYNSNRSRFDEEDWERKTSQKYPTEALDEAVVNAMVHRDYSDIAGEITINIYPSKIEIINSGEIPEDIIKGKNNIRPHHSVLRNPSIAHMFFIRGKMEKIGRGLTLIYKRFVEMGYRKPEWSSQSGYTTLSLFSEQLVIELNDRMKQFLDASNATSITSQGYEDFFGGSISERTARNDLAKLVEGGHFSKVGKASHTRYERN